MEMGSLLSRGRYFQDLIVIALSALIYNYLSSAFPH